MGFLIFLDLVVAALVIIVLVTAAQKSIAYIEEKHPDWKRQKPAPYDTRILYIKAALIALCPIFNLLVLYVYLKDFDKLCKSAIEKVEKEYSIME